MVSVPRPSKKAMKIVEKLLGKPPAMRKGRGKVKDIYDITYPTAQNRPIPSK